MPHNRAPGGLILVLGTFTAIFVAIPIRDKPIAPGSPWQNAFAERLIDPK